MLGDWLKSLIGGRFGLLVYTNIPYLDFGPINPAIDVQFEFIKSGTKISNYNFIGMLSFIIISYNLEEMNNYRI